MVVATVETPTEPLIPDTSAVVIPKFPLAYIDDINADQVIRIPGGWEQFEFIQRGFEHHRGIRLSYFNGTIEIFMPGRAHEVFKTIIGMLIETFLLDHEIEFVATGAMTRKVEGLVALEPDESYEIGDLRLAIEVNFSNGGVAKLQLYKELEVNEVWFWEDGVLDIYYLEATGYEKVANSKIPEMATIDLAVFSACILAGETSKVSAVKMLRSAHPIQLLIRFN
jgi:hypothetical protein